MSSSGLRAVVVTGLSGSGKTTALHVLEDLGFYCIDNLPVALVPRFVELWERSREDVSRVALGIDARERRFLADFPRVLDELRGSGVRVEVLYLEAEDAVLQRRFSETRRPHPAADGGTPLDGIRREREMLRGIRELADRIIDTGAFSVHDLRAVLRALLAAPTQGTMTISLVSFGYKHGTPIDADVVVDGRFLTNPFFVEEFRHRVGTDAPVARYVLEQEETQEFLRLLMALLEFTIPRYQREGKSYLTIAVGCTGGRHRSVVLAEELRRRLEAAGHRVLLRHRDVER